MPWLFTLFSEYKTFDAVFCVKSLLILLKRMVNVMEFFIQVILLITGFAALIKGADFRAQ